MKTILFIAALILFAIPAQADPIFQLRKLRGDVNPTRTDSRHMADEI